ncbi:MAG: bifunctional riboflavin kinase/FAD synthetase [Alphaproteobacteria bacterium]|nr:MAG: bifunctional riboflavin kinase/FAD synthetase [Alphaproteobacteria bacterium]
MKIFRHHDAVPSRYRGSVLTLGTFDGFHRGHQAVVATAGRIACEMGTILSVMTTEPHPRLFFRPDQEPFLLTPFRAKAHHMQAFGVDALYVLTFDAQLAAMTAQDFVIEVLMRGFGALHVVVGYDYSFGRGRAGDASLLAWMGAMEGFGVTIVEPVAAGGAVYSSTAVRRLLKAGKPREAATLLGHWWIIEGHVQAGDRRGRQIGFPTANIPLDGYLVPKLGVYAVRVRLGGLDGVVHEGVANIGRRPTFAKDEVLLEVYLFDFEGDLYGKPLAVEIVAFIRGERKFDGLEALQAQIATDTQAAHRALADPANAAKSLDRPAWSR